MELSTKILFGKLLVNLVKLLVNITNITCINDLHEKDTHTETHSKLEVNMLQQQSAIEIHSDGS